MQRLAWVWASLLFFSLLGAVEERSITAMVENVADGDTLTAIVTAEQNRGSKLKLRLAGIDAPEIPHKRGETGQPFAAESREFLKRMTEKGVSVRAITRDRYGRIVALVFLPDGRLVNAEVVRAGLAEVYAEYLKGIPGGISSSLIDAQNEAKRAKRGVWSLPTYERPSAYRQRLKKSGG